MPETIGLAKTVPVAPAPQPEVKITPAPPTGPISVEWNGVPMDVAAYFGVELTKADTRTLEMMKDINQWSRLEENDTIGGRLQKIRGLESRLGAPGLNDSRVSKAWNWIKMQMTIDEMRKRQAAYEK